MTDDESWIPVVLEAWREGQRRSAVGPGPVDTHLDHARGLARTLDAPPAVAVDLGSGAGVPGLALAGIWPESRWLLLDAAQRRTAIVERAIRRLGWEERVAVRHGRAEDVAHEPDWRATADLVVARSFGPPAVTAECAVGFLRDGGVLLVAEPPDDDPRRWPNEGLALLGLVAEDPDDPAPEVGVRARRFRRHGALSPELPRRAGVPARRPRF